jgi:hypothetical protein
MLRRQLTSHPTFRIILSLTYNLAIIVMKAAMVTVRVAPRMVGPWLSFGRTGACDNASIFDNGELTFFTKARHHR